MNSKSLQFLIGSALAASLLLAQGPGGPPDPAVFVQRRVSHLATQLSLTAAQQQQATTIFTNAATAEASLRSSVNTARQTLSAAEKNNDINGIEQASTTIGNLTAQLTAAGAKANAAFYQTLTPDQVAKYSQFGAREGGFGRGPGRQLR